MKIKIIRKPVEYAMGAPCLRCSIGGSKEIDGYYLVYRGDPQKVIEMLTLVLTRLAEEVVRGVDHPIEPEDMSL